MLEQMLLHTSLELRRRQTGYCMSVVRSQLLSSTHISYNVAFLALSHPRNIMLTYVACNAVWILLVAD